MQKFTNFIGKCGSKSVTEQEKRKKVAAEERTVEKKSVREMLTWVKGAMPLWPMMMQGS